MRRRSTSRRAIFAAQSPKKAVQKRAVSRLPGSNTSIAMPVTTKTREFDGTTTESRSPATRRGAPIQGDSFVIAINAHHEGVEFTMPDARYGEQWAIDLRTDEQDTAPDQLRAAGERLILPGYALAVLRRVTAS